MIRDDVIETSTTRSKGKPQLPGGGTGGSGRGIRQLLHFGVVGEGRYKKVLSFGSISSISEDGSHVSWTCEVCKYANADPASGCCSMCGTKSRYSQSHTTNSGCDWSDDDDSTFVSAPARRSVIRRLSSNSSVRTMLSKRLEATVEEEISVESLATDLTTKDALTTSFAMLTIEGFGGWACPDCTFVNTKELHLTCGVCGQTKPPTNKDSSDVMQHTSLQEFLTQSMLTCGDHTVIDPQIQALLKFEEMASEKEYVATLMEEQREILNGATTCTENMSELRGILEEGEETLKMLQTFYEDESKEYQAMVAHQAMRAEEIELAEGKSPRMALSRSASTPGAHSISAQVLQWHGQQQMLIDWESQLNLRKQDIDRLQSQQQEALIRLLH